MTHSQAHDIALLSGGKSCCEITDYEMVISMERFEWKPTFSNSHNLNDLSIIDITLHLKTGIDISSNFRKNISHPPL